jgi:uncharacterized membrane protein
MWLAVVLGALACYAFKLAGLSVPQSVLANRRVERVALLLPAALLAALTAMQAFSTGKHLLVDARAAGIAAAAVALLLRAPFLVVVAVAAATTALLRLVAS